MKRFIILLACSFLMLAQNTIAQTATKSYPFAVGRTGCNTGTAQIHFYNYDGGSNTITNASGGLVNPYVPQLRIGTSGGGSGSQRFTNNLSSVSFNPKDHMIYFLWTDYPGSVPTTYIWRWPVGTSPTGTAPRLDTLCSVKADLLGVAFGDNGDAYVIEFNNPPANTPHKTMLRSIDFVTRKMGVADSLVLTGGAKIYNGSTGDVAISPSGQMFFAVNNKLFTPNYKAYTGTGANITCTYIDTIKNVGGGGYVGLTYAEGETIGAVSSTGCNFYETEMLTALTTNITKDPSVFSAVDLATVVSGIGVSKNLYSLTPTGTPNQYIVEYDIYVQNYGNMDVTKVQVTDNLGAINGNANLTAVSTSFIGSPPSTFVLNSSYNGTTNVNLLNTNGILKNYPVSDNHFTIRVKCTLSGILPGVVYKNSATATAIDFNTNALTDVSTNGTNPDLNGNDKPDDTGENQPTPLLISVTAQTPPCVSLTNVLYRQTFGAGTGMVNSIPAADPAGGGATSLTGSTAYAGRTTGPIPVETFTLTNNSNNANNAQFISLTDHTGNANGRMMMVNADASNSIIYEGSLVKTLCANQQYSLSFFAAFPGNANYQTLCNGFGGFKYPKIKMRIIDNISGLIITEVSTTDITNATWQQYGLKFVSPASYSSIRFQLINDAPGGCGNDLVIDDIEFGNCDALPIIGITAAATGCIGSPATFTSSLSDPGAVLGTKEYQWQESTSLTGTYANISGATAQNYTIPAVTAIHIGKFYRVIVAAAGNMASPSCRYISPGTELLAKIQSVKATKALTSHAKVCPGKQITLSVQGGTLGTNALWRWYNTSCGGTLVGTGASITVAPIVTTTYFVRAEGDCNTTVCEQVTVTISCDIDKDKDGIPDFVESNMPAAFGDHDGDGIINAFDTDYPGFVDNDGDFVNDRFQADGDVDGDGIPNYRDLDFTGRSDINNDGVDDRFDADLDGIPNMFDLDSDNDGIPDVVEAGGVDVNGDGKLDNFIDTDSDGLSDQVDGYLSGAFNSGLGLGLKDTDGDAVPNMFDLDSDADGIPDVREVGGIDVNNNGRVDSFIDLNGDGMADHLMGANALLRTGPDTNGDGRANSYPYHNIDKDKFPNPYDIDSDGDGMLDLIEVGFTDTNFDGRADGPLVNGWTTTISYLPTLLLRDYDKDGKPDYLDIDSDNDGITDHIEGPSTFDYRMPLGIDTDGDGLDDAHDSKSILWGGSGVFPIDTDGDLIPDYLDSDTDDDGSLDIIEGHDYNFDGIANENTTRTGIDTDGDGLDDRFDLDNTSAKGTSGNLGNYGSKIGDPSPGTRAVVQQTPPGASNRDWRYIPFVLPVEIINFIGEYVQNNQVNLKWNVNFSSPIAKFEIYRSTDQSTFVKQPNLQVENTNSKSLNFSVSDPLALVSSNKILYRLEVIGKKGERLMSNVITVNVEIHTPTITILPNPAKDRTTLRVQTPKDEKATIRFQDMTGRTLMIFSKKLDAGTNLIPLSGLAAYGTGVFNIQVFLNNQLFNTKLVIGK
jgi:hypothetical protein